MIEERLLLTLAYVITSALLLLFCFYTSFSKKIKLSGVVALTVFYIFSWQGYLGILGWPTSEELPEKFNINWVVIEEPNKVLNQEGGLFLWVRELNDADKPIGDPRAYKLFWNIENQKKAQDALHRIKEGEQLNGRKSYGVLNKDNEGKKSNAYEVQEGEPELGRPSFEFVEVPSPDLPPKTLIMDQESIPLLDQTK